MYRYNNFKLAGSHYRAKNGHDSLPGTDPNEPKATPATGDANTNTVAARTIIGAGEYARVTVPNLTNCVADGRVVFKGNGDGFISFYPGSNQSSEVRVTKGFRFEDYKVSQSAPFYTSNFEAGEIENEYVRITGHLSQGANGRNFAWKKSLFDNCQVTSAISLAADGVTHTGYATVSMSYSKFVNNTLWYVSNLDNSYVDRSSTICLINSPLNSNIRGKLVRNGITYELKRRKDGTPATGTDPAIPDAIEAWPNIYTRSNFNQDPRFNDAAGSDFTLQADSPHIRAGSNGVYNIGWSDVATSILNTDDGNAAGTLVKAEQAIDTALPSAYVLKDGYSEGYIDFVFAVGADLTLQKLDLKALISFDSDFLGGSIQNKNVPDAEPITADYALFLPTTAAAADTTTVMVPAGKITVGQHVKVLGQPREVVAKEASGANDVITLDRPLIAPAPAGVDVTFGSVLQLAALTPNRLTAFMRVKTTQGPPSYPFVDSEWDNGLAPEYNRAGYMFNQELNSKPVLYIDGPNVYGSGDSDAPVGLAPQEIAAEYVHLRVFLRDNFSTKGLAA